MLIQKESGSASFGAKVVPSLQRADLSFMNSVTGSICRAKCSKKQFLSFLVIINKEKIFFINIVEYHKISLRHCDTISDMILPVENIYRM
jgi:hypothetical protein